MTYEEAIDILKNDIEICTPNQEEAVDMAIAALESEVRNCETCIHSDEGKCAFSEECHLCMWENQHESNAKHISIERIKGIIEEMEKLKEQEEKGVLYYFPPMYSARCIELLKGAIE